jgi:hypothetical protein
VNHAKDSANLSPLSFYTTNFFKDLVFKQK